MVELHSDPRGETLREPAALDRHDRLARDGRGAAPRRAGARGRRRGLGAVPRRHGSRRRARDLPAQRRRVPQHRAFRSRARHRVPDARPHRLPVPQDPRAHARPRAPGAPAGRQRLVQAGRGVGVAADHRPHRRPVRRSTRRPRRGVRLRPGHRRAVHVARDHGDLRRARVRRADDARAHPGPLRLGRPRVPRRVHRADRHVQLEPPEVRGLLRRAHRGPAPCIPPAISPP